jgi:hypothetical protein
MCVFVSKVNGTTFKESGEYLQSSDSNSPGYNYYADRGEWQEINESDFDPQQLPSAIVTKIKMCRAFYYDQDNNYH